MVILQRYSLPALWTWLSIAFQLGSPFTPALGLHKRSNKIRMFITLYPLSIGANNCARNEIIAKPILWISGFVLLILMGSWQWVSFPMKPTRSDPASNLDHYKVHGKWGGSFLQGRIKIIHGTVANRKPMVLLWTNSYTAKALLSWSGDIHFEQL